MARKKARGIYDNFKIPNVDIDSLYEKRMVINTDDLSKDQIKEIDKINDELYIKLINFFIYIMNDKDIGVITKEKIALGLNKILKEN